LRSWMRRTLEERGYAVRSTATAEAALELLDSENETFDLLVTDIVLPGMNGADLSDRVRERAGVPVLFVTGFAENGIAQRAELDEGATLLKKPFSGVELCERVGEVIERDG